MWYLTMYLAGKMHVYDQKGMSFKTWVLLIPISAAALTGEFPSSSQPALMCFFLQVVPILTRPSRFFQPSVRVAPSVAHHLLEYGTDNPFLGLYLLPPPLSARSMDYRHHVGDIIAGSLLGLLIGWYSYRQYYPALDHPLCDKPYGPRIPREEGDHVDTEAQGLRTEERHDVALLQTNGNSARGRNTVNGGPSGSEAAQTVPVEHGHDTLMDSRV